MLANANETIYFQRFQPFQAGLNFIHFIQFFNEMIEMKKPGCYTRSINTYSRCFGIVKLHPFFKFLPVFLMGSRLQMPIIRFKDNPFREPIRKHDFTPSRSSERISLPQGLIVPNQPTLGEGCRKRNQK